MKRDSKMTKNEIEKKSKWIVWIVLFPLLDSLLGSEVSGIAKRICDSVEPQILKDLMDFYEFENKYVDG